MRKSTKMWTVQVQMYSHCRLEVRASFPIAAGAEITNQYVKPRIGTVVRRAILAKKWFFDCHCPRLVGKIQYPDTTGFCVKVPAKLCKVSCFGYGLCIGCLGY